MARVVRKVSAVKGQKKEGGLLRSKKFWIILSSLVVAIVAAVIIIVLVIKNNTKSSEEVTVDDYFGQTQEYKKGASTYEVNFTKSSYSGVVMHSKDSYEDTFVDYIFVFATDLSKFYIKDLKDSKDEVVQKKDSEYENIFTQLVALQYYIDAYNSTDPVNKAALCIVDTDTSKKGNMNSSIFTFAGAEDGSNIAFFLYTADEVKKTYKTTINETVKEKEVYGDSKTKISTTAITNSIEFVKLEFEETK